MAKAVAEEIGAARTGFRVSPGASLGDLDEGAESTALYRFLATELNKLGLAFIDVMHWGNEELLKELRMLWDQTLILNRPGRSRNDIGTDVETGLADMESYGAMVLANPDFVHRVTVKAEMNEADKATFFWGGGCSRIYGLPFTEITPP